MKPAFALSLSDDGITLLRRGAGGWLILGTITLGSPGAMTVLRRRVADLGEEPKCKVIVPNDQVRYLSVETGSLPEGEKAQRLQSELTSATPYALSELVFDHTDIDTQTHIAAMARSTLDEAWNFARQLGFSPVSVVAVPPRGTYPGEPLFFPSPAEITPGDSDPLEPDTETIVVMPQDRRVTEDHDGDQPLDFWSATGPSVADADEDPDNTDVAPDLSHVVGMRATQAPAIHPIADAPDPATFTPPQLSEPATEAERMTVFGARNRPQSLPRYAKPVAAAAVVALLAVTGWLVLAPAPSPTVIEDDAPQLAVDTPPAPIDETLPDTELTAVAPETESEPPEPDAAATEPTEPVEVAEPEDKDMVDEAILEALEVAPQLVEPVQRDDQPPQPEIEPVELANNAPLPPQGAETFVLEDIYVPSIDRWDLSQDALALPTASSFATDEALARVSQPVPAEQRFDLDERGLVQPSADGTLTPDGILVFQGPPNRVPPPVPERSEPEPEINEAAALLAERRPRLRPEDLLERNERQRLGGRTNAELAAIRPKLRPASIQDQPQIDYTPTAQAIVRGPRPKSRPTKLVAAAAGNVAKSTASSNSSESGTFVAATVKPKRPSTASVARQATLDNAINLRRVNLIGVYGTPANRRALIRLPSGRYKKVKIGDRLDGGKVIAIGDSELRYQKGSRNLTLQMPKG